jgi:HSP20 family molecular chaperone IbpA
VEAKRKPNRPGMRHVQYDADRMFLELLRTEHVRRYGGPAVRPNADVYFDTARGVLVVKLELAGIDPAAIELEVSSDALRVSGARLDTKHPDAVYQQVEISYGCFERIIPLPPEVDAGQATADYTHGFLEIVLPLKARAERRRIPINDENDRGAQGEALSSGPEEWPEPEMEEGRQS